MIDGFTAPAPGISLRNTRADGPDENADPPVLWLEGVNNVVIRGIRIRRSPGDGIRVMNSENVVIDRVSVNARPPTRHDLDGIRDGTIDVVSGSRNVTVQWSLLNGADLTMLLGSGASRVSVHHNLFADNKDRQPKCAGPATVEPVCDTRNNLIWAYRQAGTAVRDHGTGNVINNYYHAGDGALQGQTIWVQDSDNTGGLAFTNGNLSQEPNYTVATGNHSQFFIDPADIPARITDARTAALEVKAGAGARGPNFVLDSTDQTIVNGISIP
jgi:pectate lyase